MKKIKFIAAAFLLAGTLGLTSCEGDVEPIGSSSLDPENPENPPSPQGDYWPMTVNNQWDFVNDGVEQPPMKIVSTEQISGKTYYKYDNFVGASLDGTGVVGTYWTRKQSGSYFFRAEVNIPEEQGGIGIMVSPLEFIVLKDNLDVGGTWTESIEQTTTITGFPAITSTVVSNGKILEKNATITVAGATFDEVIKVQITQLSSGVETVNFYWFAKNVGIVKYQNIVEDEGYNETFELAGYTLN